MQPKVNYGVDAPIVIRNLFIAGLVCLLIAFLVIPHINVGWLRPFVWSFFWTGFFCLLNGILMIIYGKYGKIKHRNRMLAMHDFKGDEQVLDVGTGRGLLMIGAAKRLTTGCSTGIDIWNAADLSDNNIAGTFQNAQLEGVRNKIDVKNENIIQTSFTDNNFDLIISNLCLHNIYDKRLRMKACKEIYRILKPGGKVIISDFKHTTEYKRVFDALGMRIEKKKCYFFSTFPPLTVLAAKKN